MNVQGQGGQVGSQPSDQPVSMSTQVTVMVDGQQKTMTIQDLANGFAAGAKMTQATQRAAELERELGQFQTLWDQLHSSPQATLEKLYERFLGQKPSTPAGDNQDDDPMSAEVSQLKQLIAQQQQAMEALQGRVTMEAQTQKMRSEIEQLKQQHGDAFKPDEVAAYATSNKITNLTTAFLAMRGEQALSAPPARGGQILPPVLPGTPQAIGIGTPPQKPAADLTEAVLRAFESAGQHVEVSDLIGS